MIILRTPKGWTAPADVDGKKLEGFWRAHQVPLAGVKKNPAHLKMLEEWLRSYKPEELFDENGSPFQNSESLHPPAIDAWARIPTQTAA
jgi:xylulose-5-phosphate/fructose-6-phosphate phosphoketolase